jgi:hypothetical protein
MQIKFGTTPNNAMRAGIIGLTLLCGFGYGHLVIGYVLDDSYEALLHSSMSNVTSIKIGISCGIPYDDCRCSVQSAKNIHLKYCLTDDFLTFSRIFPLVSFALQIFLIRDLFTLSGKHIRSVVYSLWIIATFIFFIIADGIYRDSCFHRYTTVFCFGTGGLLHMLVFYDILYRRDIDHSSDNDYNTSNDETYEEVNNEPILWRDLL